VSVSRIEEAERRYPGEYLVDLRECRTKPSSERFCVVTQRLFDALSDYTCSCPTSPSHGRVYKKNLGWRAFVPTWDERLATDPSLQHCGYREDEPERWWIYFVRNDPTDPKYQLHHPFRLLVV